MTKNFFMALRSYSSPFLNNVFRKRSYMRVFKYLDAIIYQMVTSENVDKCFSMMGPLLHRMLKITSDSWPRSPGC